MRSAPKLSANVVLPQRRTPHSYAMGTSRQASSMRCNQKGLAIMRAKYAFRFAGYLKSLGHKVPKAGVADYLAWFEDAYFLFTVRLFDASLSRANANPKKIYCIDSALVTSVASGVLLNKGHLLENLVFVALCRVTAEIFYFRSKNGREVDFIARRTARSASCRYARRWPIRKPANARCRRWLKPWRRWEPTKPPSSRATRMGRLP